MIDRIEKFGATWCGPCRVLDKTLEKVKDVQVVKYDVDECYEEFITTKGIRSVPVLIFYDGDKEVERTIGAISIDTINNILGK